MQTVFVDFFNTVVKRTKSPEDVLYDFAILLGKKYSVEPTTVYKIFMHRKNALAVERYLKTGDAEYTFEEIMCRAAADLTDLLPHTTCADWERDGLTCYIEAEAGTHQAKAQTIELLQKYKADGAQIFVLSDFYCGKEVLQEWLKRLGIDSLFDGIFVSCEVKKSKRTGKLYKYVLQQLGINPKKQPVVMIGDSKKADIANAKRCGIKTIWLKEKTVPQSKYWKVAKKYGANFMQFDEIFRQDKMRFTNYAFPLYLFEKRLCQRLEEENIKDVFFFAREGQYLKLLFDKYREITGKGAGITSHYFYASRNSLLPASLRPLGEETFDKVFPGVLCVTLRKFFTTLDFSTEQMNTIAKEIGANLDLIYADMPHSRMFKKLCKNPTFVQLYNNLRDEQHKTFRAYVESFGVDIYHEKVAVVDVGWSGTIQTLAERHFDGQVQFCGFYVGARDRSAHDRATKDGLLYARTKKTYPHHHMFRYHMTFFEQVLRADHNRVDSYAIVDGKPVPVLDTKIDDALVHARDIAPMQQKIAEKFQQICRLDFDYCSVTDEVVQRAFYKMHLFPTKADMRWIMSCEDTHYDNFMRIGYTFTPFKHFMRVIVYNTESLFFALRHASAKKIKIKTKPKHLKK